jgi:hypothetical protein
VSGTRGSVDALLTDTDDAALEMATAIARGREGRGALEVRVRTERRVLGRDPLPAGRFDVVIAGQVLSELHVARAEQERVERHAALLGAILRDVVDDHGTLVVVEPALRERTRHLHRVRDALLASGGATLFAPCVHGAPCPALEHEGDWCHEDLAVDLPFWLVPVARAAQLRWQGSTFSYLVLRRDGATMRSAADRPGGRLRVVSAPIDSKGKREAFLCGELAKDGSLAIARARVTRLDRDATGGTRAWDELRRGDVLVVDPPPEASRCRIGRDHVIRLCFARNG